MSRRADEPGADGARPMTFRRINLIATATNATADTHASHDRGFGYMQVAVLASTDSGSVMWRFGGYAGEDIQARIADYAASYEVWSYHVVEPPVADRAGDSLWQDMARAYFQNPWRHMEALALNPSRWAEHMPRNSDTVKGMLAYYASPAHRIAGRLTPIKPGRYLRRFFGDVMTEPEIEAAALVWANEFAPVPVTITTDADEIEAVYKGGPSSCMTFRHNEYDGSEHPARVYAGPDLALAYQGDMRDATSRAVVYPAKKVWMRIYGDYARMEAALLAEGYREGTRQDFEGARMRRIEYGRNTFVMPYLDVCGSFTDDGDHCILSYRGEIDGQSTSGLAGDERCQCSDCGDRYDPEDGGAYVCDRNVCDSCLSSDYFYCEVSDEYYPDSERANTRGDYSVSEYAVTRSRQSSNWFYCEGEEEWVNTRDDDYVVLDDGRTVSIQWADDNAFRCEASGEWVEDTGSNRVELEGGEYLDADYFHAGLTKSRLEKIAQYCVDHDLTPESAELRDLIEQINAQGELEFEAA